MNGKRRFFSLACLSLLICGLFSMLFALSTFAAAGCDGSGNCYVRTGASGAGTGADWTNACPDFSTSGNANCRPSSLIRGATYYIAAGTYCANSNGCQFNVADSGTLVITIQAATIASHGTATGWSNSFQGQAVFGGTSTGSNGNSMVDFFTDYWTLNGVSRGSQGFPWNNGALYGFEVNNSCGANTACTGSSSNTGALMVGSAGNNEIASHVTIEYVFVQGAIDSTDGDRGFWFTGGSSQNDYLGYSYVTDTGNIPILLDSVNNFVMEYTTLSNNVTTSSLHAEGIALRCWNGGTDTNIQIRYNAFLNISGTGDIATPCNTDILPSNIAVYGNVVWDNSGYSTNCNAGAGLCGVGEGPFEFGNFANFNGYLYIFNNTISELNPAASCSITIDPAGAATMGTVLIYNNVFQGCSQDVSPPICPSGGCSTFTYDYNSYFATPNSDDTSTHKQSSSINPFVNAGTNTAGADNYNLATDTSVWFNTNATFAANSTDITGASRTSSRGAYQYGSNSSNQVSPPTNLIVVAH